MMQIKEMTYQEKSDMYMELDKESLVKMLIQCNELLDLALTKKKDLIVK